MKNITKEDVITAIVTILAYVEIAYFASNWMWL
jgi:hypothetical protein